MPQQACVFCGRAKPLVSITKEHLFSRWVDDVLTPELLGPDRTFERTMASPSGGSQTKTWPTEVVAAIEAPVVCRGCNGGWMCGLDGQVKHLLQPMMLGQPRTLSPQEQSTIATWAAMKSMVLEYVWGAEQVIVLPQAARTLVAAARPAAAPAPRTWRCHIGTRACPRPEDRLPSAPAGLPAIPLPPRPGRE